MEEPEDEDRSFMELNEAHVLYNSFFRKWWREGINLRDAPSFSHLHDRLSERITSTNLVKSIESNRTIMRDDAFFGSAYTVTSLKDWNQLKTSRHWDIKSRFP